MKILVVEDEVKIQEFIVLYLKKEGYEVSCAKDGISAIEIFKKDLFDLIILDIMIPKMNGIEVCREIRQYSKVPIVLLTAIDDEITQVKGYTIGADDYIIKPFKIRVLLAKINRILDKKYSELRDTINRSYDYSYKLFGIDYDSKSVYIADKIIALAPKEYELLEYMIKNRNIVLSRNQIIIAIWGYDYDGGTRVVDNHIKKLRKKLKKYNFLIQTVTGIGYKFVSGDRVD